MSYEDLDATKNPHTNRRSQKIKQYSKHLYNYSKDNESKTLCLKDLLCSQNNTSS